MFTVGIVVLLLVVQLINSALRYRLNNLGIYPRHTRGLLGIVLSPFLHGSSGHCFMNIVPLFLMVNMVLIQGMLVFWQVTVFIMVLGGLLVWLLGRRALHVGASGLVMGYWAYLMMSSYTHFSVNTVILALICLIYFGNMLVNIVPTRDGTSWEGHLFGLMAGVLAALYGGLL